MLYFGVLLDFQYAVSLLRRSLRTHPKPNDDFLWEGKFLLDIINSRASFRSDELGFNIFHDDMEEI